MLLLGNDRFVTQDYKTHGYGEDYKGEHLSDIRIRGTAKVIKVVNKYIAYEDTIDYNKFLKNKNEWRDETYFNCVSITGKNVRYHQSELGGNQIELESYDNNKKRYLKIYNMAEVFVSVGDIIDSNTVIGKQGNTGLVLSKKQESDETYGSHIHFEVLDENYNNIDPREYATFIKELKYIEQTNVSDARKKQIKIIADKINIKQSPTNESANIGYVNESEVYDINGVVEDETKTWYNIKTNTGIIGFISNDKGTNQILVIEEGHDIEGLIKEVDEQRELKLIYTCEKDGVYAVRLQKGDNLYLDM
ncbi:MAG TPA: M23 family metallopeptidase [Mollicutes bacterium]|nr:M23 family metallopeptidase [Mollicutes bacterium]